MSVEHVRVTVIDECGACWSDRDKCVSVGHVGMTVIDE